MPEEKEIAQLLFEMGFSPDKLGYHYCLLAIKQITAEPKVFHRGIHRTVYPMIAKEMHSTIGRVERAIRHSIEPAHDRETPKWREVSRYWNGDKPTNGQFMATIMELFRLKMVS